MNQNGHGFRSQLAGKSQDSVGGLVTGRKFIVLLLFVVMMGAAAALHFVPRAHRANASTVQSGVQKAISSMSLPLFFEPNLGQTDPQVKFLARGGGYGLFLTAHEAVLELQPATSSASGQAKGSHQPPARSVVRMKLEGANDSVRVSGTSPLPGKSNYFIGNDPSKWRHGIPQYARVEYRAVYPGVDLVYYGNQGQLEYDFRVAPAADPNQIVLAFDGASPQIESGDLILATDQGDVRFHAPHIYQQDGSVQKTIAGSFRRIAENKIGFTVGTYDRSRDLVIDPTLSYSTYLGGTGSEFAPHVAIDSSFDMYVAGSTTSSDFPKTNGSSKTGAQNVFIAEINSAGSTLLYATYLGGTGLDAAAGIAVGIDLDGHPGNDVYVAGTTTSGDFPTTSNAFQTSASGSHSFVTKLNPAEDILLYSTYLAGNGTQDSVTGLAIDTKGNAFVTGVTTSTNPAGDGFPANPNGFQTVSNGPIQIFATEINTRASTGPLSMLYSTYFGGGNPVTGTVVGGGIAVDSSGNMYFTGATNFLGVTGTSGEVKFPLYNAQQSCLDESGITVCTLTNPTALDAFVAKINPNIPGSVPLYSTYLGGANDDTGLAIAVDASGSAYVTGSTFSMDWAFANSISPFQPCLNSPSSTPPCPVTSGSDAFIAKVGNITGTSAPLTYFTYLGGSGDDRGLAIAVDATQAAHLTGSTASADLLTTSDALQGYGGANDAFVALISTTGAGRAPGDYLTYLGGSLFDQGTGIALDANNATYVTGETKSADFHTKNPLSCCATLKGTQDAFLSKIGASSTLALTVPSTSPSPNPVAAGNQVAFTFDIANQGPDTATTVIFTATIPSTGVGSQTAKVTSGGGSCSNLAGNTLTCTIATLAVGSTGVVEVDLTPTIPVINSQLTGVSGVVSANGGPASSPVSQPPVTITDFSISATAPAAVTAGASTSTVVTLTPAPTYSGSISMSDSGLPTNSTATFTVTPVVMSGTTQMTTTLNIATQPRPVTTGSLPPRHLFYATWLPVGGLSLLGLGVGANWKRRRWLAGLLLGLIAGLILLQGACGSSGSSTTTGGGTPPGTYPIVITGSSGTVSHNTTVYLTVN